MGRKWKVFTFIKNDPLIEQAIFNSVQNNRLFSIRDECLYFKSDFHKEEVLNLEISLITDFEKLNNIIVKLIEIAHEEIINIKTSQEYEDQDYSIQFSGKIEGIVNGLLHKACYTSISVIDFAIILFVRIARAHAWRNGNKRTSIVSLSKILSLFGFALK
jgi:prophage maintenance system killer protein